MWGVLCPEHPWWGAGPVPTDRERYAAEAFAEACACGHPVHLGVSDYPTGGSRAYVGNRWVETDRQGYRVVFDGTAADAAVGASGDWSVVWFAGAHTRVVRGARGLSRDEAHVVAWRLAAPR